MVAYSQEYEYFDESYFGKMEFLKRLITLICLSPDAAGETALHSGRRAVRAGHLRASALLLRGTATTFTMFPGQCLSNLSCFVPVVYTILNKLSG